MTAGGNLRFLSREDSFEMTEYRWHDSGRSEQGHSLFPGIVRIQCPYRRVYAAAHVEIADNLDPFGAYLFHKVFQDFIHRLFVKDPPVAVGIQVEFQGLHLNQKLSRHTGDNYLREVGLRGHRAKTCEFGKSYIYLVIMLSVPVFYCLHTASLTGNRAEIHHADRSRRTVLEHIPYCQVLPSPSEEILQ